MVVKTKPKNVFKTCRLVRGGPSYGVTIFRTKRRLTGEGYPVSKGGVGDYVSYGDYSVVDNFNKTNTFSSKGCGVAGSFNNALCRRVNGRPTVSLVRCISRVGVGCNNRNAGLCSATNAGLGGIYVRGGLGLLSTSIERLKASVGCIILRGVCTRLGSGISFCFSAPIRSMRILCSRGATKTSTYDLRRTRASGMSKCTMGATSDACRDECYVVSIKEDKDG